MLKNTLTLELEAWTVPDEISIKNTEWRSSNKVRKRRRSEAGDSAGGGNGSGANNNGPVDSDADGIDNWFTKVSEWRDESAKKLWPFMA